LQLNESIVMIK